MYYVIKRAVGEALGEAGEAKSETPI